MQEQFKTHIETHFRALKEARSVIAISGGIDSVVLAHLYHELELDFALAHCNFKLRGKESDADEAFVVELAEKLNVEVFTQSFDTKAYAQENKLSIQMSARELRYNWFKDLAKQLDFDFILTAHHADDNLETFLINFTRSTGLNGLTGIPPINDNIIRPLLSFSREQIETFAKANNINWREDSSNSGRKYLRNKLRHEVVPILKSINPELLESFQNTLENLNDTADIVDESLNAVAKRAIVDLDENEVTYKVSEFKKVNNPKAYLFEMFKDFGFTAWNDLVHLLDAETGKFVSSNTHRLTKHREFLILTDYHYDHVTLSLSTRSRSANEESFTINKEDILVETPIGKLKFEILNHSNFNTKTKIYIDADLLDFPLQLRQWQTGDVFQPIGMTGKKKVSKYLKDEKLKPHEKENTWVLLSDEKIVWVIGRRVDDRFKVTDKTNQILKIELQS